MADVVNGTNDNDVIDSSFPDGRNLENPEEIHGFNGNDTIYGYGGDDVLLGEAGNDFLDGGAGADELRGGNDHDVLVYDEADTVQDGGSGHDNLLLGAAANVDLANADQVSGGGIASGFEDVDASALTQGIELKGSEVNNWLIGGLGNDTIEGRDGDDWLEGGWRRR